MRFANVPALKQKSINFSQTLTYNNATITCRLLDLLNSKLAFIQKKP